MNPLQRHGQHQIRIEVLFNLTDRWLRAISAKDNGIALLTLQGDIEHHVRRIVRRQLRAILAELGGDPWSMHVADPRHPRSEREQREGEPMAPVVPGPDPNSVWQGDPNMYTGRRDL